MLEQLKDLTPQQRVERYYTAVTAENCRRDLRKFIRRVWPIIDPKPFQTAWHIDVIAEHLAYVVLGDIRNLMINIPPRMTKSSIVSVAFPAWVWTEQPEIQFICASYEAELAEADAIKMRMIVESEWYRSRYPDVVIWSDQNRVNKFTNTKGGYRETIGVGRAGTTGKGGDYKMLDDPHNAATIESNAIRKGAVHWHDNAWRSRNNDPNTVRNIYTGQRTHDGDIFGHVLGIEEKRWVVLALPMEYDGSRKCITYANKGNGPIKTQKLFEDPRTLPHSLLAPERFNAETAEREKEAVSKRTWNAQYQQQPEGAGGVILKRNWWQKWGWPDWHPEYRKSIRELPEFFEVIQSYDTAFEPDEQDSYSVRTTWGMFSNEPLRREAPTKGAKEWKVAAMLLERRMWRPTFGQLLDDAVDSNNMWEPDRVLVEKKASGHSLIQELRRKQIPVRAVKVQGDLIYRAHMASLPLEKRAIYYPDRNWAMSVIEECAKFPDVDFNDQVASCVIAWMYMRKYMDLQLEDEDDNEEDLSLFDPKLIRKAGFYSN